LVRNRGKKLKKRQLAQKNAQGENFSEKKKVTKDGREKNG